MALVKNLSRNFGNEKARDLQWYRQDGGFQAAHKALFEMTPDEVTSEVTRANLRGLGGAGFPTGRKWQFIPKDTGQPKYLAVNADEAEPGTFKDKYIITWDPFRLIEGIVICCRAVGINTAYIYIRGEYARPFEILRDAVAQAYQAGVLGERVLGQDFKLEVNSQALADATGFLDEVTDPATGHAGYTKRAEPSSRKAGDHRIRFPPEKGESMTAVGLFIRFFLDQDPKENPVMEAAAKTILAKPPVNAPDGSIDHYYWYYATYALYQMGGRYWTEWQKHLAPAVVNV